VSHNFRAHHAFFMIEFQTKKKFRGTSICNLHLISLKITIKINIAQVIDELATKRKET